MKNIGAVLASLCLLSCGSSGTAICSGTDPDCFLAHLTVQQAGADVPLQSIAASLLTPSGLPAGPPFVWAVGTRIAGWDGAHWTEYPNPTSLQLNALWALAAGDVWAGGAKNTLTHWNGTAWSVVSSGGSDSISGMWGSSPSDLWAVTSSGMVAHYTGSWSAFAPIATNPGSLGAIWGFGPGDIWAAGSSGTAYHYNGTTWAPVSTPASSGLSAIWGSASNDVWAASGANNGGAILIHWNGAAWSKDAAASSVVANISGPVFLWGTGPNDIWISGYNIGGEILAHYDGAAWTKDPSFNTGPLLQGGSLWAGARDDLWMVAGPSFVHRDGTTWAKVDGPAGPATAYQSVRGLVPAAGGGHGLPPSITNQPPAMTFAGAATVTTTLAWSDSNGCQPSFCFSLCRAPLQCTSSARCSRPVRDGLLVGSTILTLGYTATPAAAQADLTLSVVPVSSAGCKDPIAMLTAGTPGALVGGAGQITQTVTPPPATGGADCNGGFRGSTSTCVPLGAGGSCVCGGNTDLCITPADFASTGVAYPGSCNPEAGTGCLNSTGTLAHPCCPGLTCKASTKCGGGSATGGTCLP